MSKSILVCTRRAANASDFVSRAKESCRRIAPDNISPTEQVVVQKDLVLGVYNPDPYASSFWPGALISGTVLEGLDGWESVDGPVPDGSFAIYRFDEYRVQLIADFVASRTIWYFHNEDLFIAATSQRMIVTFLGSFESNDAVMRWFLSAGTLGPLESWDRRIKRVSSGGSVTLDRSTWKLTEVAPTVVFRVRSEADHEVALDEALRDTFQALRLNWKHWPLPLSGGGDSRAVLHYLVEAGVAEQGLRTITWGLAESRSTEENDAAVAALVAEHYGVPNDYYFTDLGEDQPDVVLRRFLAAGEGRVAHLGGYMDGMRLWKNLFEEGVCGTIRGDQGFGLPKVVNERDVRLKARMTLFSDIGNLAQFSHLDWPDQILPEEFERRNGETLAQWRDRLSLIYRIPTVLAGLSDIKLVYGEQVTPLVTRKILTVVSETPDHLRTNKALFRRIAKRASPEIPMAKYGANAKSENILKNPAIHEMMMDELARSNSTFPAVFRSAVSRKLSTTSRSHMLAKSTAKTALRRIFPAKAQEALRKSGPLPRIDWEILALRVLVVSRMNDLLAEDSSFIKSSIELRRSE